MQPSIISLAKQSSWVAGVHKGIWYPCSLPTCRVGEENLSPAKLTPIKVVICLYIPDPPNVMGKEVIDREKRKIQSNMIYEGDVNRSSFVEEEVLKERI